MKLMDWVHGSREKELLQMAEKNMNDFGLLTEHEQNLVETFKNQDLRGLQRLQLQKLFECMSLREGRAAEHHFLLTSHFEIRVWKSVIK